MSRIFAGTSGFAYPSWKPDFYPANLPAKKFLGHYSGRLNCVEINYTFRTLPSAATLSNWIAATPEEFVFCPKAPMRITHILKLKDAGEFTEVFLQSIDPLRRAARLGPILFQLPPTLKCDAALLSGYLSALPRGLRYAFEFRHVSWLTDEIFGVLRQHKTALCIAESENLEAPEVITAEFIYFRLRKPAYSSDEIVAISRKAQNYLQAGRDLFVFFKHEDTPEGALHAEQVLRLTSSPLQT